MGQDDQQRAEKKRQRIAVGHRDEKCPECGGPLGSERVGSGQLANGVFCSLACIADFHKDYFHERARASNPSCN